MALGVLVSLVTSVIVVLILYIVAAYNSLINKKIHAEEGWNGVDVALKRRYDLIPNLVSVVKEYAEHEQKTLEKIIAQRVLCNQSASVLDRAENEDLLGGMLNNLFAVAEDYPDLKVNTNFLDIQKKIYEIEDNISLSCRYYNASVRELNILIKTFPTNLISMYFGFKPMEFFEIQNVAERGNVEVTF